MADRPPSPPADPGHPLPRPRGAGGAAARRGRRPARPDRSRAVAHGRDDRAAAGRARRRCAGATSTGPRVWSAFAAATHAVSGRRPRADGRVAPCRWRIGSQPSSSATSSARPTRTTTTWSSAIRRPAGPYDASKSRVRFKAGAQASGAARRCASTTSATLRHADGRGRHTAAHASGWMGHRDYKTTEIYADFAPDPTQGAVWAERAFGSADHRTGTVQPPVVCSRRADPADTRPLEPLRVAEIAVVYAARAVVPWRDRGAGPADELRFNGHLLTILALETRHAG